MTRLLTSLLALTALLAFTATAADDKKDDKKVPFKGTWVKEAEGVEIAFHFEKPGEMELKATAGESSMTATCKVTTEKGTVKAEVTKVTEKGEFPQKPPVGYKFSFKFKAEKGKATLSDFDATNKDEVAPIVEGEYKAKKAD
jgi:hypothetical protein